MKSLEIFLITLSCLTVELGQPIDGAGPIDTKEFRPSRGQGPWDL